MTTPIFIYNGKAYRQTFNELYDGWTPAEDLSLVETKNANFKWKGAKITFTLWEYITAFMRWTQKEFKAEALITLFYNQEHKVWAADVFPQQPMGMTVKSLETDPLYAVVRKKYGKGWIQAGSVHHHCTTNAFQSSTDHEDESDRDGLHITLGKMTDPVLDIHCRAVFDGIAYNTNISTWVNLPAWFNSIPELYQDSFNLKDLLLGSKNPMFPEEWKAMIKPLIRPAYALADTEQWRKNTAPSSASSWDAHQASQHELALTKGQKKTQEGAKETEKNGTSKQAAGTTDQADEGPTESELLEAGINTEAAGLSDYDILSLKGLYSIMSDLGLDGSTCYDLIAANPVEIPTADLQLRVALFTELKNKTISPNYAITLLEKIGAELS